MKMSIITVAYKSPEILLKSINSLFKYNDLENEIEYILVDNSPVNERVNLKLPDEIMDNIIYVPADNQGFGAGNNVGAKHASGEILAFINPDIIFIEPILKNVYENFKLNQQLVMMGCKLLNEDLSSGFSFYFDYKYSITKKWTLKLWNKLDYFNVKNMYISGANIFIRKKTFFDCGMFDENIFMYYEEPDLTRRVKLLDNNLIKFNKDIKMIHLEKKSTPNTLFSVKQEFKSAIYYGRKYGLDYIKKIKFEYRYLVLKRTIYYFIDKNKYKNLQNVCQYIEENYGKIIN